MVAAATEEEEEPAEEDEVFVMVTKNVGTGLWQVAPAQPLGQVQENWSTSSVQVPPFRQGEESHSFMLRQVGC